MARTLHIADPAHDLPPAPPTPPGEADLVDSLTVVAHYLVAIARFGKIACVLLALLVLGLALRLLGV